MITGSHVDQLQSLYDQFVSTHGNCLVLVQAGDKTINYRTGTQFLGE